LDVIPGRRKSLRPIIQKGGIMTRVLAIDPGARLGWAVRTHPQRVMFGTEDFSEYEGVAGRVHTKFHHWFSQFLVTVRPDVLISEAPIFRGKHSEYLYGFSVLMTMSAFERGMVIERVNLMTVKAQIANHGRAEKERMIRAVRELGYPVETEHEADAVAILLFRERRRPEDIPNKVGQIVNVKPRVLNRLRRRRSA
jgi:Holliday junction resolvasome RuvABC endonuclease subunit